MVTWENYEEYMMLYADDELDEAGVQELLAFVGQNPELQAELKAYAAAKLVPDTKEIYEAKETLLKPVPAKRVIAWKPWTMAAAAGVALVIGFSMLKWSHPSENNHEIPLAAISQPSKFPVDLPVERRDAKRKTTVPHKSVQAPRSNRSVRSAPSVNSQVALVSPKLSHEELETLTPAASQITASALVSPALQPVAYAAVIQSAPGKSTGNALSWLPVSEESKAGINAVGAAINDRVEQVKKIRNNLKETSFVLSLGKKEFTINL